MRSLGIAWRGEAPGVDLDQTGIGESARRRSDSDGRSADVGRTFAGGAW